MSYKTILLKGDPLRKEGKVNTGQTIYPGMLVAYVTNDATLKVHDSAGGNAAAMVAVENALEGQEIITPYAAADIAQYVHLRPGDEFLAYLDNHETVAVGTFLESNGNGYFRAAEAESTFASTYVKSIVAKALEAVAGTGSSRALIKAVAV